MSEKNLNLLKDFPPVSTQEWMDKIIADLKGADFEKRLVWRTKEGFNVMPFYRQENLENLKTDKMSPGVFPFVQGTKTDNCWLVRQNINADDAKIANVKALDILNKGVDSLGFTLNKEKLSAEYIATLLNGIRAEVVELNFQICVQRSAELAALLTEYFQSKNYDLNNLCGSINLDPINRMLLKGKKLEENFIAEKLVATVKASNALRGYRVVGVNPLTLSNAGAYIVQELGYALSWGHQYLKLLIDNGIDIATAAKSIKFNFGVSSNYFMEIAKFRAARWLWANIVATYKPECNCGDDCHCMEESGLDFCPCACKMKINAQTSYYNMTVFDSSVNMLRSQTEAMSAALGAVDSLVVLPYDSAYKQSDDFSERIARNQQLLLKEESHFDKVTDPAAGSYYIENLTNMIAQAAWNLFVETEDAGGFFKAVQRGDVQNKINETAQERLKDLATRKEILLGTNQFPNFTEKTDGKIERSDESTTHSSCNEGTPTFNSVRQAIDFEQLRLAVERAPKTPKAFMLTIGNLAMRLARSQFSSNFFACAGYEIIDNNGFNSIEEGIIAAQKANADLIVLCSSDEEYADIAPAAFKAINGKQIFVVAGAPQCMNDLQKLGIENFINVKTNVLEALKEYNKMLGI